MAVYKQWNIRASLHNWQWNVQHCLQEEDWNVPGRGGTAETASEAKASDVKGSIGHGDAL